MIDFDKLPAAPDQTYKGNGWKGWDDFLGTGIVRAIPRSSEQEESYANQFAARRVAEAREQTSHVIGFLQKHCRGKLYAFSRSLFDRTPKMHRYHVFPSAPEVTGWIRGAESKIASPGFIGQGYIWGADSSSITSGDVVCVSWDDISSEMLDRWDFLANLEECLESFPDVPDTFNLTHRPKNRQKVFYGLEVRKKSRYNKADKQVV